MLCGNASANADWQRQARTREPPADMLCRSQYSVQFSSVQCSSHFDRNLRLHAVNQPPRSDDSTFAVSFEMPFQSTGPWASFLRTNSFSVHVGREYANRPHLASPSWPHRPESLIDGSRGLFKRPGLHPHLRQCLVLLLSKPVQKLIRSKHSQTCGNATAH